MGVTVKLLLLLAVPPEVVTDTMPVTAPGITVPTRVLPVLLTTMAFTLPMEKAVGVFRFVPLMVTNVPTLPLVGVKEVMVGGCACIVVVPAKRLKSIAMGFMGFWFLVLGLFSEGRFLFLIKRFSKLL